MDLERAPHICWGVAIRMQSNTWRVKAPYVVQLSAEPCGPSSEDATPASHGWLKTELDEKG